MIYNVSGILTLSEPNFIVIDCNGVGFGVKTSLNTVSKLPKIGDKAKVFTHLYVKEDILDLYGFATSEELVSFKQLIAISGVGPKAATSILSELTPERFALCVATGDAKALTKAQGIGLKTAQRIVLELKDKVSKQQLETGVVGDNEINLQYKKGNAAEAISALVVLGYAQADAVNTITRLDPKMSVEDMIKAGLKALAMRFD